MALGSFRIFQNNKNCSTSSNNWSSCLVDCLTLANDHVLYILSYSKFDITIYCNVPWFLFSLTAYWSVVQSTLDTVCVYRISQWQIKHLYFNIYMYKWSLYKTLLLCLRSYEHIFVWADGSPKCLPRNGDERQLSIKFWCFAYIYYNCNRLFHRCRRS